MVFNAVRLTAIFMCALFLVVGSTRAQDCTNGSCRAHMYRVSPVPLVDSFKVAHQTCFDGSCVQQQIYTQSTEWRPVRSSVNFVGNCGRNTCNFAGRSILNIGRFLFGK